MQETQSEASLDREPLADSVRSCECLHSGGLHDECVYSCMVAAGVPNGDLPSRTRDEFILYMKGFSGSKIRAALWLSWTPSRSSRSARLCDFISCSPELLPHCPCCKAGLAKARQGAQNETKTPE